MPRVAHWVHRFEYRGVCPRPALPLEGCTFRCHGTSPSEVPSTKSLTSFPGDTIRLVASHRGTESHGVTAGEAGGWCCFPVTSPHAFFLVDLLRCFCLKKNSEPQDHLVLSSLANRPLWGPGNPAQMGSVPLKQKAGEQVVPLTSEPHLF